MKPQNHSAPTPAPLANDRIAKLAALASYIEQNGYGPTIREMCALFNVASTSVADYHLRRWLEEGLVSVKRVGPRQMIVGYTLRLTDAGEALVAKHRAAQPAVGAEKETGR